MTSPSLCRLHTKWARALQGTLKELQEYVKTYHTIGPSWNPEVSGGRCEVVCVCACVWVWVWVWVGVGVVHCFALYQLSPTPCVGVLRDWSH